MPTYDFRCSKDEAHRFERFLPISSSPDQQCPQCGAVAHRLISGGSGVVFKGGGWYHTDYGGRNPSSGGGPRAPDKSGAREALKLARDVAASGKPVKGPLVQNLATGKVTTARRLKRGHGGQGR